MEHKFRAPQAVHYLHQTLAFPRSKPCPKTCLKISSSAYAGGSFVFAQPHITGTIMLRFVILRKSSAQIFAHFSLSLSVFVCVCRKLYSFNTNLHRSTRVLKKKSWYQTQSPQNGNVCVLKTWISRACVRLCVLKCVQDTSFFPCHKQLFLRYGPQHNRRSFSHKKKTRSKKNLAFLPHFPLTLLCVTKEGVRESVWEWKMGSSVIWLLCGLSPHTHTHMFSTALIAGNCSVAWRVCHFLSQSDWTFFIYFFFILLSKLEKNWNPRWIQIYFGCIWLKTFSERLACFKELNLGNFFSSSIIKQT